MLGKIGRAFQNLFYLSKSCLNNNDKSDTVKVELKKCWSWFSQFFHWANLISKQHHLYRMHSMFTPLQYRFLVTFVKVHVCDMWTLFSGLLGNICLIRVENEIFFLCLVFEHMSNLIGLHVIYIFWMTRCNILNYIYNRLLMENYSPAFEIYYLSRKYICIFMHCTCSSYAYLIFSIVID